MTPSEYFDPLLGQSLYYPGEQRYKGECPQTVLLFLAATGTTPPIYPFAYQYYEDGIPGYTQIPAGPAIQDGDIIVWGSDFPPSGGDGHIDVATGDGTIEDFWGYDSNWTPPLTLSKIHHVGPNNNYIVGYLRKEEDMQPTPKQVGDIYTAMTGNDISQEDLNFYITAPRTVYDLIYALFPATQKARDTITLLENERDTVLYPYVNTVSTDLGIPDNATDLTAVTNAIESKTGTTKESVITYITNNLN